MGLLKFIAGTCTTLSATVLVILFLPNFPPDAEPEAVHIKPPITFEGWFESNTVLDEAELYYESDTVMESLVLLDDNSFISGDQHGNIVKVIGKQQAVNLTTLKFPCGDAPEEINKGKSGKSDCGWPLGMRLAKNGHLYLMDFYGGLVRVDMKTGKYEAIVPKIQPVDGKLSSFPEDLDVALDGTVYWSDGSSGTSVGYQEILAGPTGRLIKYDPVTHKNEVLVDKLYFSNGVCLSSDEKFVLVAEIFSSRIMRYHLAGKMKGKSDIFVDGLPGYPDNIRSNGRGGFYVPLGLPWNDQFSLNAHILGPRPFLRKFLLRTGHVIVQTINYLKLLLPDNVYLDFMEKYITGVGYIYAFEKVPRTAQVVELSSTGHIIGVLNAKRGDITALTQMTVGKEYAFLNSYFDNKIWRVRLDALKKSK